MEVAIVKTKTSALSELHFLLAEDNVYTRRLIFEVLEALGVSRANILTASDGGVALEILKQFPVDIVITDALMEPIDGIELIKSIRTSEDISDPMLPIILCTAYTEEDRIREARDAGVTEIIAKPFSVQTLHERICAVVENPRIHIHSKGFSGPDRRRHEEDVEEDRRGGTYKLK